MIKEIAFCNYCGAEAERDIYSTKGWIIIKGIERVEITKGRDKKRNAKKQLFLAGHKRDEIHFCCLGHLVNWFNAIGDKK